MELIDFFFRLCVFCQTKVWNDWVSQSVRLYAGSPDIELVQNVGPIPIADG